jgi:hypothetical protein
MILYNEYALLSSLSIPLLYQGNHIGGNIYFSVTLIYFTDRVTSVWLLIRRCSVARTQESSCITQTGKHFVTRPF